MILDKSVCSHCGETFEACSMKNVYSIRTVGNAFEVITGELVPEALHYCSDRCMFDRKQGVLYNFDELLEPLSLSL